ncbi:hypothetical protein [Candidatus Berkiella aquae]|uniref:Uncharacterized protein n=1 Tax=Candidatus Berkiella aquae TaxID=295108 RepID=A0A0Q9YM08_9GAMM|nr:hypothetical protein [Candidatus Berkiella aquae]MCS5710527.1 hypothetical protein [Candidatus Berkiella aquae]
MKIMNHKEIAMVAGASQSIYYYEGYSSAFECPNVSQECLNSYMGFLGRAHPDLNIPSATIQQVAANCGGLANAVISTNPCLDPALDDIRAQAGY